jgi:uncharacterized repeat protein (TIGR01451 family)
VPVPVLTLSKTGPAAVLVGEPIIYTLTVTNSGITMATNLVITDAIPAGATYLSGGIKVGGVVSWTLDSLAIGATAQVTFAVTATDSITNSDYRVEAAEGVSATGQQPVSTEVSPVPVPVLTISKQGPATALAGQPISYTLIVTNSGTATATNLVITDAIPAGATYVSGGTKVGNIVRWTIPRLTAKGGVAQVTFVVTATQAITNQYYGTHAEGGYRAQGSSAVFTQIKGNEPEPKWLYLPLIVKQAGSSELK